MLLFSQLAIVHQCILIIRKKDILVFGEGLTQGLNDTAITRKAKYSIKFTRSRKKIYLSLHCNGRNSFLFVNATKICQFKAIKTHRVSEIFQKILQSVI